MPQNTSSSKHLAMRITDQTVKSLAAAKSFNDNTDRINHMDYTNDGLTLITSSFDDSITVYDISSGTKSRSVNSKKYGVDLIHFAHARKDAIHASTKVDNTIRYLSLHDNKYLRYFLGHQDKVVTLCMSPLDDLFLSGSLDKTIRLWDLRSQNCQGLMQLQSRPIAAFDPEGLIFAAGIGSEIVKLYDLRSFDKGPFNTFSLVSESAADWTGMRFSPDGKSILITTNGSFMRLIDAFQGSITHTLSGHENDKRVTLNATFSPDSKYIFCGSTDNSILCWSRETGRIVERLKTDHMGTVENVLFNPKFFMMASACSQLEFLKNFRTIVQSEPPLLEIEAPICICGDIHGQYTDLLRIFETLGRPSTQRYLFLGDYIDRGPNSLEVISLLFLLKIRYPDRIFLLRGNHECSSINFVYGFHEELDDRFPAEESQSLWSHFQDIFNWMPLVALVGGKILCMHGGISPLLSTLEQLRQLDRPIEPGNHGLHVDLIWADPNKDMPNESTDPSFKPSMRGISYEFSEKAVHEIISKLNIQIIVRAHQVVMDGYEFFASRHLVTVFTAPNYCGTFGNKGAVMLVSEDYGCYFRQFEPVAGAPTNKRLRPKEVTLDDIDSLLSGD